jgi:misacylated tRNA(Ala) deacylase
MRQDAAAMTIKVFYQDSYLTQLDAVVSKVDGEWLEFDQTIFYPEGGGQPGDTGTLLHQDASLTIVDTRKGESLDSICHQLSDADHALNVGDHVQLQLNWARRYRHMRMHSCLHLLGSLIPVPVTGGSVGELKSRLDFDVGEYVLDKEKLTIELNKLITASTPVSFESMTDAQLDANPGLIRTMSVQPPRGSGTIRMVRMADVDYQPCGGTHINNTAEIGPVSIRKIENKGKRNRRVHLVFDE